MKFNNLLYEKKNKVGILSFNRPQVLNALNLSVLEELDQGLSWLSSQEDVKVIIITGLGKAFVAGADIGQMSAFNSEQAKEFSQLGSRVFRKLEEISKPVIAAVNGFALGGGCELALSCDFRIASEKAKFGQPEVSLGIIPGFAGTQRLSRLIGISNAKEMIYTGKMLDAREALSLNLVNDVVAEDLLMDRAIELAEAICKNSQSAVAYAKACINQGYEMSFEDANVLENLYFGLCFSTEDQKEGMAAFLEKERQILKACRPISNSRNIY